METISRTLEIDGKIEDVEIDVNVTHYVHVPSWLGSLIGDVSIKIENELESLK